ncbi:amidase [Nesterenkonia muleiensis]|uniref:amidase n=1 Tax=Nesterenkonia muleiensis TaxID=2282648 RepID=UPI001EE3A38F|nr:amidase [Nesterenkonia muleiensis]
MDQVAGVPRIPQTAGPSSGRTTDLSMADFRAATAAQWRYSVLTGEVSCVELTTTALTAAATMSGLGAFLHLDPEFALARAELQDATLRMLRERTTPQLLAETSPLVGLPTAFKDLVPVAGLPLTWGTAALPATVPAADAPLARTVHRAGGISIGKTQVPEFGLPCYSENQLAEPARNPLALTRTAGGSSGGGAAAVAAGMLPFAPGNDGGGSVRIPAAACGLVGLKPGRGRVPDDAASASVRNLVVSGPMATSAEDAALLFDVMAKQGRFAQSAVHSALDRGLAPLQVGVTTDSPFSPDLEIVLAEEAMLALEEGISALTGLGHRVQGAENAHFSRGGAEQFWTRNYHQNFQALWTAGLAERGFTDAQVEQMTPLTQYFVELSQHRRQQQTDASIAALQEFSNHAEDLFGPCDVLMTPMLACAPPELGWFSALEPAENYVEQCRFTPYSSVVNVLGLPAINVPVHTSSDGLSWSVQLIGRFGSEERLLALAATMMSN